MEGGNLQNLVHGTDSALHLVGICVSGLVGFPTFLASLPSSARIRSAGKRLPTCLFIRNLSASHRDKLHICQPPMLCVQDQPRLVAKLLRTPSNFTSVEITQQRHLLLGTPDGFALTTPNSNLPAKFMRCLPVVSLYLFVVENIVDGCFCRILVKPAGLKFDATFNALAPNLLDLLIARCCCLCEVRFHLFRLFNKFALE